MIGTHRALGAAVRSSSRPSLSISLLLAAALGAVACETAVLETTSNGSGSNGDLGGNGGFGSSGGPGGKAGQGGFGTSGPGGNGGQGGGSVAGPTSAIAEYASSLPPKPSTSSTVAGGAGFDPHMLFVRIGNYGPACGNELHGPCGTVQLWEVRLGIPPNQQSAGTIFPLSQLDIFTSYSVLVAAEKQSDCFGGGGYFKQGQLEILSNDGATIVVRISGSNTGVVQFGVDVDGDYAVPICP
ncbi:Hypothetical protein A7982_04792 [Minicystis rosea]|nr:Hypothetical protein A7982_04792 [Minicystis rosea]